MDPRKRKRLSHAMSSILRHRAGEAGLTMDAAGWVTIEDLCRHMRVSRHAIAEVVAHNNKSRYQIDGDRIRASQGHSLEGMPVTQKALEDSWTLWAGSSSIWHGTRTEVIESIAHGGILRGGRTHVHLAKTTGSRVGKRSNVAVLLEVSPSRLRDAGHEIFCSPNGVILTRHVPPSCIIDIITLSRRSKQQVQALRGALALS